MKLGRVKQCDPHLCPFSVGRSQMENIREASFMARLSWIVFLLNIPCEVSLFITWGEESEMKLYSFFFYSNEIIFIHIFLCDGYLLVIECVA